MTLKSMKVRITLDEEMLGTMPNNKEIYSTFIASKSPDAKTREQEIEEFGCDAIEDRGKSVFLVDENGRYLYDYHIKGFFKDACRALRRGTGTISGMLTAYKQIIDGMVFPKPRKIYLCIPDGMSPGECQRPLRADTPKGSITSVVCSETVPAGTSLEVKIVFFELEKRPKIKRGDKEVKLGMQDFIEEWLDYGALRGLGQWRNSGKGVFSYEIIE
jgi:hypothetical protein